MLVRKAIVVRCFEITDYVAENVIFKKVYLFPGVSKCIVDDLRCNGENDCEDEERSDECDCSETFVCAIIKQCFPNSIVCDGVKDCEDGSDEVCMN